MSECAAYCASVQSACGDAGVHTSQYADQATCEAMCRGWGPQLKGEIGDTDEDTIGCRHHWAEWINRAVSDTIKGERACTACLWAGPTGGGRCGAWCDSYCRLTERNCGDLYTDADACLEACDPLGCNGVIGQLEHDTVFCRISHATLAGIDDAESHCAAASADGGDVCQGERAGEACDEPLVIDALPYSKAINPTGFKDDHSPAACGQADLASTSDLVLRYVPKVSGVVTLAAPLGAGMYLIDDCEQETCKNWNTGTEDGVQLSAYLQAGKPVLIALEIEPVGCGPASIACGPGGELESLEFVITGEQTCGDACDEAPVGCDDEFTLLSCSDVDQDGCLDAVTTPCEPGETCQDGECVPTCVDECNPGPPVCDDSNAVLECQDFDGDGCTEWFLTPCPASLYCVEGVCLDDCFEGCEIGAVECEGEDAVKVCVEVGDGCGEWFLTPCEKPTVCKDGACVLDCQFCDPFVPPMCVDDGYELCEISFNGCTELAYYACPPGTLCGDGACIGCSKQITLSDCQHPKDDCESWVGCSQPADCKENDLQTQALRLGEASAGQLSSGPGESGGNWPDLGEKADWYYVDLVDGVVALDTPAVEVSTDIATDLLVELRCQTGAATLGDGSPEGCEANDDGSVVCTKTVDGKGTVVFAGSCADGPGPARLFIRVGPSVSFALCEIAYQLEALGGAPD